MSCFEPLDARDEAPRNEESIAIFQLAPFFAFATLSRRKGGIGVFKKGVGLS